MANKQELEDQINEKLETDINWSELQKEDMEKFLELLDDEEFVKVIVGNYVGDTAGGVTKSAVKNWAPGKGISVFTNDSKSLMDLFL